MKVQKTQEKEVSTAVRVKETHSGGEEVIEGPCHAVTEVRRTWLVDINLLIENIF